MERFHFCLIVQSDLRKGKDLFAFMYFIGLIIGLVVYSLTYLFVKEMENKNRASKSFDHRHYQTGVLYMENHTGAGAGLTVIVYKNGNPLVDRLQKFMFNIE